MMVKFVSGFLLGTIFFVGNAAGASLLKATSFPETIHDVSLADQIANKAAGYTPFKDAKVYMEIQLQSVNDALADEIERLEQEHELYCLKEGQGTPECMPYVPPAQTQTQTQQTTTQNQPQATAQNQTQQSQNQTVTQNQNAVTTNAPVATGARGYCAVRHPDIKPGQMLPFGVPVLPSLDIYTKARKGLVGAPFGVHRGGSHYHQGVDLGVNARYYQTPIFAVADGTVSKVGSAGSNSSAGNYVRLVHQGGWISYYMHLDAAFVKQGQTVQAGCQIGTMGHTGGAVVQKVRKMGVEMTHLHYEIRNNSKPTSVTAPDGTVINNLKYVGKSADPVPFLKH